MLGVGTRLRQLEPEDVWKWSAALLYVGLTLSVVLILLAAWKSQLVLFMLLAVFGGGLLFATIARSELALLCVLLMGFVVAARYEAGFQIEEAVYGILYLSYFAHWYTTRLFFYTDRILRSFTDWALFLFLIYATLSLALTPILDGDMQAAISQWLSISMLGFYFPVREICLRSKDTDPRKYVLLSMGVIAGFIAIRNFLDYRRGFVEAEYLWEIVTGRVVMNEHILMMAGLTALTFLLFKRRAAHVAALGSLFIVFLGAVVVGQSRALWLSFALGVGVIFLLVDRKRKIQILVVGSLGVGAALVTGYILFEESFSLIMAGLLDRFFSLKYAVTKDISLINRFLEAKAAWEYIKVNPIVGYGFGVPITYYSLVFEATRVNSFIHNGYVGVLYRHGLIGFVLVYGFYFGSIWNAFRTVRSDRVLRSDYVIGTAVLACLVAESLVANTQNPFATSDYTLIIGVATALGSASWLRTRRRESDLLG